MFDIRTRDYWNINCVIGKGNFITVYRAGKLRNCEVIHLGVAYPEVLCMKASRFFCLSTSQNYLLVYLFYFSNILSYIIF